jgi:hypothetical protein
MSDEQCGADPFENGYDQKLSEKEYRERIKYLMRCHDDSADEIERLRKALKTIVDLCDGYQPPAHLAAKIARAALTEQEKQP